MTASGIKPKTRSVFNGISVVSTSLCVAGALGVVVLLGTGIKKTNAAAERNATLSTAHSICAVVSTSQLVRSYPAMRDEVGIQAAEFEQNVIKTVMISGRLDGKMVAGGIRDAWGNLLVYRITSQPEGGRMFSVISPGPDGKMGSPDDVVTTINIPRLDGEAEQERIPKPDARGTK